MTGQLPLPLAYAQALGEEDFFISDCNRKAVTWLDLYPRWGHHATLLLGPHGSGKSHLAAIFRARHGNQVQLFDQPIMAADEASLFHLFNATKEMGAGLLIVQEEPPAHIALPDLASRLAAVPVVRIEQPDEAVLGAVMIKSARDRGLSLPPEVLAYVLPRLERSFAAVHAFIARLDATSLAERRALTIPLASRLLSG